MFDHSKTILHHNHEINSDYLSCLLIYGLVLIELSDRVLIYLLYRTIYNLYQIAPDFLNFLRILIEAMGRVSMRP